MKIKWTPQALTELKELEQNLRKEIKGCVEDLKDDPLPDNSTVIPLNNGKEMQRLKLQEEDRNSELNHRIFYNIKDGGIKIYGVFDREAGYAEMKKQTQNRT